MSDQPFDFNAYLEKSADDVKRPKPIPSGTYLFLIKEKEFGFSSQKKTPFVEFTLIPQSTEPDVDQSELGDTPLHELMVYDDFYLTPKAEYRLLDFATLCGVNTQGRKLSEIIAACIGQYIKGHVKIVPNRNDPTKPGYNEIDTYASTV